MPPDRCSLVLPVLFGLVPLATAQGRGSSAPEPGDPPTAAAVGDFFVECVRGLRTYQGGAAGDQFGWVSAPLDDVTGDGVPELVIGAPTTSASASGAGRLWVRDGRTFVRLLRRDGAVAGENLGFSARDAGDVDGDGLADVIAGGEGGPGLAGRVRVYSVASGAQVLFASPGLPGDSFGYAVTGLGDLTGDGLSDVAVGAIGDDTAGTDAGRLYVLNGADGSVIWTIDGEAPGDNLGSAAARLADVTGDGLDELVVSAMNGGPGNLGKTYVYDVALRVQLYAVLPDASGANFGQFFVADCGDVDLDGFHDVYVSDFSDGGGRGKAYVFDGPTGALLRRFVGTPGSGFGIGRGVGDVNGDGHADLILCGWTDSSGASGAGKCEVFSGADGALLRSLTSTTRGEAFGFDAHGAGDVDGDGHPDYVVTAAQNAGNRGQVYVLAGGPPAVSFGTGLAGSGGLEPVLSLGGCPELGEDLLLETRDVRGGAPGLLVLGTTPLAAPVLGGILYTELQYTLAHAAGGVPGAAGGGTAALPLSVPLDPALAGIEFIAQAAYLDPEAPRGVSFTGATRFLVFAGL